MLARSEHVASVPGVARVEPLRATQLQISASLPPVTLLARPLSMAGAPGAALLANTPEPTVDAALKEHRAVGQARLRVWGFEVYDASLWAAPGFDAPRFAAQRFGLELHYRRAFAGRDIAQRSIDEMRGATTVNVTAAAASLTGCPGTWGPDLFNPDISNYEYIRPRPQVCE